MKRKIVTFVIILICFLLESTVFQNTKLFTVTPNLLIIVTSSFGFMRGKKEGMMVGWLSNSRVWRTVSKGYASDTQILSVFGSLYKSQNKTASFGGGLPFLMHILL